MAIIWQHLETARNGAECLYQVRSAGQTRRLYSNGVFHSQYNPQRPVAGSVWDLLLLPAFMQSLGSVQRVLVLGVGGGAVIKQLLYFLQPQSIVGVELNPVHIDVAQRFFDVQCPGIELIEADAISWLKAYQGPAFDLIIDDLFGEEAGQPCRAVAADSNWCAQLLGHLADDGALVMNFDEPKGLLACAFMQPAAARAQRNQGPTLKALHQRAGWHKAWCFSTPLYSNAIACFSRQGLARRDFHRQLQAFKHLDERLAGCKLNYRLQTLRLPS